MTYGVTGGPIEHFREGWGVPVNFKSHGIKPHYWKRHDLTHVYRSLCGVVVDQSRYHPGARQVFSPGVFMVDRCKLCRRRRTADSAATGDRP